MIDQEAGVSQGTIVAVQGSVIDVHFPDDIPELYNELKTGDDNSVVIEVVTHLNSEMVRGITLTPTSGLACGSIVMQDFNRTITQFVQKYSGRKNT